MDKVSEIFPVVGTTAFLAKQTGVPKFVTKYVTTTVTGRPLTKFEHKWAKMPTSHKMTRTIFFFVFVVLGILTLAYRMWKVMPSPQFQQNDKQSTPHHLTKRSNHIGKRSVPTICGPGDVFRLTDGQGNNLIHVTNNAVSFMDGKMSVTPSQFQVTGNFPIVATDSSITMGKIPGTTAHKLTSSKFQIYRSDGLGADTFPS